MKTCLSTIKNLSLFLIIFTCPALAQENTSYTAFINATIIDGTGAQAFENATLVMEGDRISCVGNCEVPSGSRVIDAKGKFIIPGLIDAHVHDDGTGGVDTRGMSPDRFPYKKGIAAHTRNFGKVTRRKCIYTWHTARDIFNILCR